MNPKERILLVEDEDSLAAGLEYNLTAEGYEVTWVTDGKKAFNRNLPPHPFRPDHSGSDASLCERLYGGEKIRACRYRKYPY